MTGQIDSMNSAFRDMGVGLLFAAVFVYLLMVVNYQNFGDPLVVILALPATFCGIVTMLYITDTTLNVPSLMGAIMAVGVASANSILLVTFAREQQLAGLSAFEAAVLAGHTRIRPVLMTAAAMIVGMIPMAIGGPGEEQNAALARAVIGGLLFATPTTLIGVPYLFALLRRRNDGKPAQGVFSEEIWMAWDLDQPVLKRPALPEAEWSPQQATPSRSRRLAPLFWSALLLALLAALGGGVWRHYQQHREIVAIADQQRDFVPSVRVAEVKVSPLHHQRVPARGRPVRSPAPISTRAPAATSPSATSTSGRASRQATCLRRSPRRSSTIRLPKPRRP